MKTKLILTFFLVVYSGFALAEDAKKEQPKPAAEIPFVSNFLDYYHNDLKFGRDKDYTVSGQLFKKWDWAHSRPGSMFPNPSPNTMPDLSRAMNDNPELRVLVQQGYYDLATPAFATEYMMDHLTIAEEQQKNITIELYDAGHMMYLHPPSLVRYKKDLASFIDSD